jgi:hypothetical protein
MMFSPDELFDVNNLSGSVQQTAYKAQRRSDLRGKWSVDCGWWWGKLFNFSGRLAQAAKL